MSLDAAPFKDAENWYLDLGVLVHPHSRQAPSFKKRENNNKNDNYMSSNSSSMNESSIDASYS